MPIELGAVPPSDVDTHEKIIRPLIQRMEDAAPGHWTWEHVREEAKAERLHLWFAFETAEIVMLVACAPFTAPGGRRYYDVLFAAGGRLEDVFHPMMDKFDQVARACGAKTRIPHGRPGWKKLMAERGMRPVAYTYEAED